MVQQIQSQPVAEEELPIDIDYAKFLDWLIDRRRIPRNWHVLLKSARALVRVALAATPPSAKQTLKLDSLPPHYNLNYFRVLDVRDALASPEAPPQWNAGPDKDLIGRWKSPVVRAWSDAVTAFQSKSVFLADCAQLIVRNADIEATALRATISKLQTDVTDFARREAPAIRGAEEAKERFVEACEEFDMVDGQDVDFEAQLREAVAKRVPEMLRKAVSLARDDAFVKALAYYEQFARYVAGDGGKNGVLCETVRAVMEGDVDSLTRESKVVDVGEAADSAQGDIDWGAMLSAGEVTGLAETASSTTVAEIDWGIEIDASGTGVEQEGSCDVAVETTGSTGGINWDESSDVTGEQITVNDGQDDEASEANTITLTDANVRELYLTDLLEIDAFLSQRLAELSRSGNSDIGLIMQQAASAPDCIKAVGIEEVKEMQCAVQVAIGGINSSESRRILGLQCNPKLLERVARSVLEKKHVAERMHGAIDVVRTRRARAAADLAEETPKFDELANETRDVKRRTELALSELYKGRVVNMLGEVNNVFPPVER